MKIAWILLISLFVVCMLDESNAWRRRRFRVRIRVRRIVRNVVRAVRVRRLIRNIGSIVKNTIKKITKLAFKPQKYIAKKLYKVYLKYKALKNKGRDDGSVKKETCKANDVCGGSCVNDKCTWHCANLCDVMVDDKFTNWPGELVVIPCKFAEYDYGKLGYIKPADLAWHMNERGREPDNMMVFNKLDQNGDGQVSEAEFNKTKDILLKDEDTCEKTDVVEDQDDDDDDIPC